MGVHPYNGLWFSFKGGKLWIIVPYHNSWIQHARVKQANKDNKYFMIVLLWCTQVDQIHRDKSRWWVPGGREKEGTNSLMGTPVWEDGKVLWRWWGHGCPSNTVLMPLNCALQIIKVIHFVYLCIHNLCNTLCVFNHSKNSKNKKWC